MVKKNFGFLALMVAGLLSLASCNEQEEEYEFEGWKEKNEHYLDSIATAARMNEDGSWKMYKAYNLGDSLDMNGPNLYYIYVQELEHGTGTYKPLFNDSVRVHYMGQILPSPSYPKGFVFGKSYANNVLNEETDVPALMGVNSTVVGFSTALMNMVEGDRWRVVVPYYLGYGEDDYASASIPGYSTLIFDIKLARVYRYKIDTDTSWY